MEKLYVIKIGASVLENTELFEAFLTDFIALPSPKILVHGGGSVLDKYAASLQLPQTMVKGRRLTDAETRDLAVMVYAGLLNKRIVARLQMAECPALGLSGTDAHLLLAEKRNHSHIDYGYVGDLKPSGVNHLKIQQLLTLVDTLVFSSITVDYQGVLLNTNADSIACNIAIAMQAIYDVELVYCFEQAGVLDEKGQVIPLINLRTFSKLKEANIIQNGMIPKLTYAIEAIKGKVQTVRICKASMLHSSGTKIARA